MDKYSLTYLSSRCVVYCGYWALLTLAAACGLPLPLALVGMGLGLAAGWFWLARPYLAIEDRIALFLEGYAGTEGEAPEGGAAQGKAAKGCAYSPAGRRLFRQFQEMIRSSQVFHMNKRQAQYLALQNQINPHFLYNTLESIRSEAMMAGLLEVADMTESLAVFFRYTITKVENLVSVEEEIQNCETYFNIQKYRFGERIMLDIACSPEDREDIFRCRLPKLTMQPILENSMIHGTELKMGTGHLTIYLERTPKRLLIRISDDGLGMDEATLTKINAKLGRDRLGAAKEVEKARGGLALANVDRRIRLLFGDEYGLHVFSLPGIGTDVEISLPAISSDRDVRNKGGL